MTRKRGWHNLLLKPYNDAMVVVAADENHVTSTARYQFLWHRQRLWLLVPFVRGHMVFSGLHCAVIIIAKARDKACMFSDHLSFTVRDTLTNIGRINSLKLDPIREKFVLVIEAKLVSTQSQ